MENLDLRCAELGRDLSRLPKLEEKLLTEAMGVLDEQGLYALFLFLTARGKDAGKKVSERCWKFLCAQPAGRPLGSGTDPFSGVKKLGENLDDLLFARELLQQALVYARYHLKAEKAKDVVTS